MSDTIEELIAEEIESRLQNVTTANGFNQDLIVMRPPRMGLTSVTDLLTVVESQNQEPDNSINASGDSNVGMGNPPFVAWNQPFHIFVFSRQSETDSTSAETILSPMVSDVVKAVTRQGEDDAETWYQFGGNSRNAQVGGIEYGTWHGDGSSSVAKIPVMVNYRHTEGDPTQLR